MIGKKGLNFNAHENTAFGDSYKIGDYHFPVWAITPHIEEEKRDTVVISDLKDWNDVKEFYRDEYEEAIKDLKEVI